MERRQRDLVEVITDLNREVTRLKATLSRARVTDLDDLGDVVIAAPATRHALIHNGSEWVNRLLVEADISDLQAYSLVGHDHDADYAALGHDHDADYAPLSHVGAGGAEHANAVGAGAAGFMSGADKSKLDGIEAGATADQSAAEILAALLTVDGTGSGIDADLLDGYTAGDFARLSATNIFTAIQTVRLNATSVGGAATAPQTGLKLVWDENGVNLGNNEGLKLVFGSILTGGTEYENAYIASNKDNITDTDTATSLIFATRANADAGTTATERVRLTSGGDLEVRTAARLGYGTGAGGTQTQTTSKSNGVTLNAPSGQITLHNETLNAGAEVTFTLTNSVIAATDAVIVNHASAGTSGAYLVGVSAISAGSCAITVANLSTTNKAEAIVLNFAVIKGASS